MAGLTPSREQLTEERDSELWKSLENKNLYKVLGVPSDASSKDIDRAFRVKARDVHPDKHTDALSTERFKELTNAKDLLLDVGKRWWYDQRREKEAEAIARALEAAKLRAKAKSEEEKHAQDLTADEGKRREELVVEKEKLAKFLEEARAHEQALALKSDRDGNGNDEDVPVASAKLRASAPEFVPAGSPLAHAAAAAPDADSASATPVENRIVEVYSVSAQRWCLGFVVAISPLPDGRAAVTIRYQVTEGQWHEKMLYDNDPNLRKRLSIDGEEKDKSAQLWNQFKRQHDLRAEAPGFAPGSGIPQSAPSYPGTQPHAAPTPFAPPRQLQVTVPLGCIGGQHMNILTRAGRLLTVQIPPGLLPGQTFFCTEPLAAGFVPPPGQQHVRTPVPQVRPMVRGRVPRPAEPIQPDDRCTML